MKSSLVIVVVALAAIAGKGPQRPIVQPYESPANLSPQGKIDELVFKRLRRLDISPAPVCSDGVFVRRVYLDTIGTLPTAAESREFLPIRTRRNAACSSIACWNGRSLRTIGP